MVFFSALASQLNVGLHNNGDNGVFCYTKHYGEKNILVDQKAIKHNYSSSNLLKNN